MYTKVKLTSNAGAYRRHADMSLGGNPLVFTSG